MRGAICELSLGFMACRGKILPYNQSLKTQLLLCIVLKGCWSLDSTLLLILLSHRVLGIKFKHYSFVKTESFKFLYKV
jgi:hypothetical protein